MRQRARIFPAIAMALVALAVSAAEPARPDLTGIWLPDESRAQPWPARLPLTPAARSFMEKFDPASHDPASFCMPFGTPRNMMQTQYPMQIVQTPQRLVMVLQPDLANAEVRRVPFGATLPKEPDPSWFGTSSGRWEGTTLIIETIGLRDDSLISSLGIPHSDKLRVIERLSIANDPARGKVLVDDIELQDSSAYVEPLRTRRYFVLAPQANFPDASCVERKWTDKIWRDRLQEHAEDARAKAGAK
jgi:hypothetical protein